MTAFADNRAAGGEVRLRKREIFTRRVARHAHTRASSLLDPHSGWKISPPVPVWVRDPQRTPSRRASGASAPRGAAQAAGLRGPHGYEPGAGLPQLADKALRLALRGAPVVIALA